MLDGLEVQDQLKNFSQEQLLKEMRMPSGSIPQFLILSELNRRRTMSQDMAKRQSADQPTVKEEVVAASGMPMDNASMMAQQMAPKTSMTENTGIASMMPRELPSEEEPMKMSYGGVLNSRSMVMGQPLMRAEMRSPLPFERRQQADNLGFNNLGSNIVDRIGEKSQGEVDEFIGEVRDMADERFDLDLTPEPQFDTGGKGFPPFVKPSIAQRLVSNVSLPQPMYRKEGGPIKAQSGMFAQMMPKFPTPPAFASLFNYIKTNFPGISDADATKLVNEEMEAKSKEAVNTAITGETPEIPRLDMTVDEGSPYDTEIYGETRKNLARLDSIKDSPLVAYSNIKPEDYFSFGRDFVPESDYEKFLVKPTLLGLQSIANIPVKGTELSEKAAKGIAGFFEKLPTDEEGKPISQEEYLLRYVGQPAKDVDAFNKMISDQLRAEDDAKAPAERDFRKRQEQMIYEESMKRTNRLAKKDEEEEEKKKKQKEEEDRILGGFGKASGALSDLSAQIAELKEKREKGRESEKWFSLAKLGLGMLASANPTVFGALGEGGLKALEDFKAGKKAYDDDILGYLKTQASIAKSQAELGVRGLVAKKQIEALKTKGKGTYGVKEIFDDIAKIDERLQKYAGAEFTIKSEDDLKEINRLRT